MQELSTAATAASNQGISVKYAKKLCKRLQALLQQDEPREVFQPAPAPALAKRPSQGLAAVQQMKQGRSSEDQPSTPGNAAVPRSGSGGLAKPASKPTSPEPFARQSSSGRVSPVVGVIEFVTESSLDSATIARESLTKSLVALLPQQSSVAVQRLQHMPHVKFVRSVMEGTAQVG